MTAYGRGKASTPIGTLAVEIQSVNRKHLEVQTNLPREFLPFDSDIKKWVAEKVSRGQVNLKLSASFEENFTRKLKLNLPLAQQLHSVCQALQSALPLGDQKITPEFFLNFPGMVIHDEEFIDLEIYRSSLKEAVEAALAKLVEMKGIEGKSLQKEIEGRFLILQKNICEIKERSTQATEKYRQKLKERLEEVLPGSVENEERILREVCLYADRIDIAEEIVRFQSHLDQCRQLFLSSNVRIGKNLEFILQELHREINTIGSKTADVQVSHLVVDCKAELERIREQLQNVE
ncbi:YicC/YloC family endoribonuclease [Parachlamydia sp. AcF125]|uniref:YicC/YloC family endoribonuclease n=1 Tax=Parachlamydia sp. AcF125 TaxID=2795736 RepID=UPI0020164460|nr:YicC/YloC family endoribonuclease [Parachlamydia sp. AcF125]